MDEVIGFPNQLGWDLKKYIQLCSSTANVSSINGIKAIVYLLPNARMNRYKNKQPQTKDPRYHKGVAFGASHKMNHLK